jgi:hypothetical protein
MLNRVGVLETYLSTCIVFVGVWLLNPFLGMWLSVVFGLIGLAVLMVALMSEWIEPSRVPRRYFWLMGALVCGILSAAAAQYLLG